MTLSRSVIFLFDKLFKHFYIEEMIMKNIGGLDKTLRILIGIIGISLVFFGPQTLWGWAGLIPLLTGAISFCPLYKVLGLNTCPIKSK